jgi:biotin carboxyl carrier protein
VPDDRDAARDDAARAADHAGIGRLADALVPALIAKLGSLNVGELEVREGEWRIRLRRPAGAGPEYGRRATDRPSRSHPGHEQHGHAPGAPEPHRAARPAQPAREPATNGSGAPALAPVGPGLGVDRRGPEGPAAAVPVDGTARATIATSPAVGVFQPGPKAVGGTRVRTGDRLGVVDMLGVPQEVVSPVDGIVVGVIVEAGTAVEYGQELIQLESAVAAEGR